MAGGVILAWALLALALLGYWLFLFGRLADRFGVEQGERGAVYRFRLAKSAALFVAPSLVSLAALGRLSDIVHMPSGFGALAAVFGIWPGGSGRDLGFLGAAAGGLVGGGLAGALIGRWRAARGRPPWMIGDLSSVMPRGPSDLPYSAAIAISAGIAEELFFRLTLPLLVALVSGSVLAGFAASTVLFILAHRYQGPSGMLASAALAMVFTGFYWMTASLWMTMVLHALIDLNGLVLRPVLSRVRVSGDSPSGR